LQHKIVEQVPAADGTKRFRYALAKKGKARPCPLLKNASC
jgi:hypothetical protein